MKFVLTFMTGSRAGTTQELETESLTFGRDPSNAVAFDPEQDDKVSTQHASIEVRDGRAVLTDLGSTNGTFINGQRVSPHTPLPLVSGAVVTFGEKGPNVAIQFETAGAGAPAAGATAAGAPAGGGAAAGGAAGGGAAAGGAAGGGAAAAPQQQAAAGQEQAPAAPEEGAADQAAAGGDDAAASPPKKGRMGCCLKAGGTVGGVLLLCIIGIVIMSLSRSMPSWARSLLREIPGARKVMKPPRGPRMPGGMRTPRPRLDGGSGSGSEDEAGADGEGEAGGDGAGEGGPPAEDGAGGEPDGAGEDG